MRSPPSVTRLLLIERAAPVSCVSQFVRASFAKERIALTGSDAGLNSTGLVFEAHQVFTFADRDRNGTMDRGELDLVRRILASMDPDLIPAPLTKECGARGSHTVPALCVHPVLMPIDRPALCAPRRRADRAMTWEKIDTDGNGTIDRAEWIDYVTREAREHGERPMLKLMKILSKRVNDMWM